MKNYIKYTEQYQNGILKKKHIGPQWYPNQYYGSPLSLRYTSWLWESPNIKN